ncbi:hypothetical protein [Silvimonas iriomotensis]|uniref:hypothetical protein n=1 Tax=Silvimonas iriomotensis TaxID=449662 RepID=UPI0016640AE9|nr:hypothetical protein [Silvimonas iriomotensis]
MTAAGKAIAKAKVRFGCKAASTKGRREEKMIHPPDPGFIRDFVQCNVWNGEYQTIKWTDQVCPRQFKLVNNAGCALGISTAMYTAAIQKQLSLLLSRNCSTTLRCSFQVSMLVRLCPPTSK